MPAQQLVSAAPPIRSATLRRLDRLGYTKLRADATGPDGVLGRHGLLSLGFGSVVVAFHPVWTGIPAVLTAVGYLYLVKAAFCFLWPATQMWTLGRVSPDRAWEFRPPRGGVRRRGRAAGVRAVVGIGVRLGSGGLGVSLRAVCPQAPLRCDPSAPSALLARGCGKATRTVRNRPLVANRTGGLLPAPPTSTAA